MQQESKPKKTSRYRNVVVPARVTSAELEALQRMADERCCSVSAVIRWAIHQHIMGERSDVAMQNAVAQTNGVHQ